MFFFTNFGNTFINYGFSQKFYFTFFVLLYKNRLFQILIQNKIESFTDMFMNCTKLTSLDVSNFDVSEGQYFDSMFDVNL